MAKNQQSNDLAALCRNSAAEIKEIGEKLAQADEKFLKSLSGTTLNSTEFSAEVEIRHAINLIGILTDALDTAADDLYKD